MLVIHIQDRIPLRPCSVFPGSLPSPGQLKMTVHNLARLSHLVPSNSSANLIWRYINTPKIRPWQFTRQPLIQSSQQYIFTTLLNEPSRVRQMETLNCDASLEVPQPILAGAALPKCHQRGKTAEPSVNKILFLLRGFWEQHLAMVVSPKPGKRRQLILLHDASLVPSFHVFLCLEHNYIPFNLPIVIGPITLPFPLLSLL